MTLDKPKLRLVGTDQMISISGTYPTYVFRDQYGYEYQIRKDYFWKGTLTWKEYTWL